MDIDPRLHFVVVTGIIVKDPSAGSGQAPRRCSGQTPRRCSGQGVDHKFLIAKRAAHEKAHPNKWTVPGGKLVRHEYETLPKTADYGQWYNVVDWVLRKEIREEVGLEIGDPRYLTDLVFIRPDGYPVVTLSYWCRYKSGEVVLGKDLTEFAWVTLEEVKKYDLIDAN